MQPSGRRIRVFVRLPRESDGWPPVAVETVWVEPLANGLARVDNVPFFIQGVSLDDVVELRPAADGPTDLELHRVVTQMGHQTIRVVGFAEGQTERAKRALHQLGCVVESAGVYELVAVDIPPDTDDEPVFAWLEQHTEQGLIDFEEGAVFDR